MGGKTPGQEGRVSTGTTTENPEEILRRRLAAGEITVEQYREILKALDQ